MSKLHYFQRYSSKENWMTNSTLLLFSRLYQYDRLKFEVFLNSILEDGTTSLQTGISFSQQTGGKTSVPDGLISQDSFKILIETKLYDNFSINQLERHLAAFGGGYSKKILIALSKSKFDGTMRTEVLNVLQDEKYKDIKFASTTYEEIYYKIQDNLSDYDLEMREILEDYIALCKEQGLTNMETRTMAAFTAGSSFEDNLTYAIYYDDAERNHNTPFQYIGLYKEKAIRAVGKVVKIAYCDYKDGELLGTYGFDMKTLRPEEYTRIKNTIENTKYFDLQKGIKFFLVDKFYTTHFEKTSFSSLRAKRYFWLNEVPGFTEGMSAEQVAELLNNQTWQ